VLALIPLIGRHPRVRARRAPCGNQPCEGGSRPREGDRTRRKDRGCARPHRSASGAKIRRYSKNPGARCIKTASRRTRWVVQDRMHPRADTPMRRSHIDECRPAVHATVPAVLVPASDMAADLVVADCKRSRSRSHRRGAGEPPQLFSAVILRLSPVQSHREEAVDLNGALDAQSRPQLLAKRAWASAGGRVSSVWWADEVRAWSCNPPDPR